MADLRKQVGTRIRHWRQLRRHTLAAVAAALDVEVSELVSTKPSSPATNRLSPKDYQTVREALDSIDTVLKRFRPPRSGRTTTS